MKACVLGALLPATDNAEADLEVFEKLMAIDDEAFLRREFRPSCLEVVKRLYSRGEMPAEEAERLCEVHRWTEIDGKKVKETVPFSITDLDNLSRNELRWNYSWPEEERGRWELRWVQSFSYLERVSAAKRPEELAPEELFEPVWPAVNAHLGTDARTLPELVDQLGILRFGKRPRVGDTFCGGGSIPFEAARLGCDVTRAI